MTPIMYRTIDVDGLDVFYREAGSSDGPNLLLLHGFPSSSHMFRDLIPRLGDRLRVISPSLRTSPASAGRRCRGARN